MAVSKQNLQRIIGKNIKKARVACGYTKELLAEKAEISVEHITQVERGNKMLSTYRLVCIADSLHVSVDSLLEEKNYGAKRDIAKILVTASEEESKKLFGLLQYAIDNFCEKN